MGRFILYVLGFTAVGAAAGTFIRGFWPGTAIGAAMGALGGAMAAYSSGERKKELQALAPALGFTYRGQEPFAELPPLALVRDTLGNPGFRDFIQGEREGATLSFCDARIGINATPIRSYAVAILHAPDLALPHFVVHPHLGLAGLYNVRMRARLELPTAPKVNAVADDPAAAALFTPEVIALFERDPDWYLEGSGGWLVAMRWAYVYQGPLRTRALPVRDVPAFLDRAMEVFRLFRR